jgi:hypothetical protein
MAILFASAAGTVFGPIGVIVSAEALALILVTGGILFLSQDRWLTFGLAAALAASLVVMISTIRSHESHGKASKRTTVFASGAMSLPVNWEGQAISQAMANGANFRGADLDGANLNGIQLSHKNFDGAQADGASFRGSQLQRASLRGASLRGACLQGANLIGADLTGADFSGADIAGVIVTQQATKEALVWPATHSTPTASCISGPPSASQRTSGMQ